MIGRAQSTAFAESCDNLPFPQIEEVVGVGTFRGVEAGTRAGGGFASRCRPISWPWIREVVERLSAPAENELQNVVKLFQRKVVRYRNQPGDG